MILEDPTVSTRSEEVPEQSSEDSLSELVEELQAYHILPDVVQILTKSDFNDQ